VPVEPQRVKGDVVFVPDVHVPGEDPDAIEWALKEIQARRPAALVFLGDLVDAYHVSGFDHFPVGWTFGEELAKAGRLLQRFKAAMGTRPIWVLEGNHDFRPAKQLVRRVPGLAEIGVGSLRSLLKLNEMGFRWVAGERGFELNGVRVLHGVYARKWSGNSVRAHLEKLRWRQPVVMGHCHRLALVHDRTVWGMECGWLGLRDHPAMDYEWEDDWAQGLGILQADGQPQILRRELVMS